MLILLERHDRPDRHCCLRRAFLAEGNRRLGMVRSLTHTILIEHDLMHARNDPLAQFLPHPVIGWRRLRNGSRARLMPTCCGTIGGRAICNVPTTPG